MGSNSKKKHYAVYKAFDQTMQYRADKAEKVNAYNLKHKTNYRYVSEFVQLMHESKAHIISICETLDITKPAVYVLLDKLSVRTRKPGAGGHSNHLKFSDAEIADIRTSTDMNTVLALKYHVSATTIGNMKRGVGHWGTV